jgi:hypothetical protein
LWCESVLSTGTIGIIAIIITIAITARWKQAFNPRDSDVAGLSALSVEYWPLAKVTTKGYR